MQSNLHRFARLVAVCTLCQVIVGALVTSREAGLSVPDWPLAYGRLIPRLDGGIVYEFAHRMLALLVTVLTAILAVWLWRAEDRQWLRPLGFFALFGIFLQIVLGGMAVLMLLPPPVSALHACLAQLFFSLICAIVLFTGTTAVSTVPFSSAGIWLVPWVVLAQVALGALARHKALGYIWHIGAAAIVTGVVLWATVRILICCPGHIVLRRSALSLLTLVFCQIFLGIAAYMSRLATADAVQPMPVMITFTVLHVASGALVMAASTLFVIEVSRQTVPAMVS